MGYILGVFPDQQIQYKIRGSLGEIGKIFDSQDIPINYNDRDTYHVTLLYLGRSLNYSKRKMIEFRLRNYSKSPFSASIDQVRLGISRDRRELLFFPIIDGAQEMRSMVYEISKRIYFKRDRKFIPHITIARIRKDLTDQEFQNLTKSISDLNNQSIVPKIEFTVNSFNLAKFDQREVELLKKFLI